MFGLIVLGNFYDEFFFFFSKFYSKDKRIGVAIMNFVQHCTMVTTKWMFSLYTYRGGFLVHGSITPNVLFNIAIVLMI